MRHKNGYADNKAVVECNHECFNFNGYCRRKFVPTIDSNTTVPQ